MLHVELRIINYILNPRLHIFNPDTDYALANGGQWYTPPSSVVELRKSHALLPALYATPHVDAILLLDTPSTPVESLLHYDIAISKGLRIFTMRDLAKSSLHIDSMRVEPWGWNHAMRRFVVNKIGNTPGLPTTEAMDRLRELSHRRTTIAFMQWIKDNRDILAPEIMLPEEVFDTSRAMEAYGKERRLFFKTPWSSSGRGILLTDDLEPRHVEPWVRGIIERQGSVMMEKAYEKKLDFASEWRCSDGNVEFLGWSVFETSRRGKYHGQIGGSQTELRKIIDGSTDINPDSIIEAQHGALESLIASDYDGPLGIDMLTTAEGAINPCVEINLRHTMGMLNLKI